MPPLTSNRELQRQPIELVITRSCRTRKKETEPLKNFQVGEEATFIRLIGDELVSLNKAVVKGSPQHKVWIESQKVRAKAPSRSDAALTQANEKIADLEEEIVKLKAAAKK